jgi:MFS family permease
MFKSRPTITDRFGRKPCIVAGCIFMIIGCIINTAAQDYASELHTVALAHTFHAEANHLQCSALVVSFSDSATRSAS